MKTHVYICFNGAVLNYIFDMAKEAFLQKWNNHLPAVGYFSGYDEKGNFVVINPENCGVIEIREIKSK